MPTIDRFDIAVNIQYARRTEFMEAVQEEYRLTEADTIPPQLQVVDWVPRLSEMDILFGVVPRCAPWAFFYPPKFFDALRRSPFSFSRMAPSLGSSEKQQEDMEKLAQVKCNTPEEMDEKKAIQGCYEMLDKINDMMGFIVGRVGQFLQG